MLSESLTHPLGIFLVVSSCVYVKQVQIKQVAAIRGIKYWFFSRKFSRRAAFQEDEFGTLFRS